MLVPCLTTLLTPGGAPRPLGGGPEAAVVGDVDPFGTGLGNHVSL